MHLSCDEKRFLVLGELTRDIRRYPWYITRVITAAISRVIYHGYLRISSGLCHEYKNPPPPCCPVSEVWNSDRGS